MLQESPTPKRKRIGARVISDTVISLPGGVQKYEGGVVYTDPWVIRQLEALSIPFDPVFE